MRDNTTTTRTEETTMARMTRREAIATGKLEADTERCTDGRKGWFGVVRRKGHTTWRSDIVTTVSEARDMAYRGLDEVVAAERSQS